MGLGAGLSKFLILIFNFLFVIFGIVLIVYGFFLIGDVKNLANFAKDATNHLPVSIIFLGLVIFLISFFGCCGAMKENYCLLYTYGSIVLIILILELIAAGFAYKYRDNIKDGVNNVIHSYINDYPHDKEKAKSMDDLQEELKCCGANSYQDWEKANSTYPPSCCKDHKEGEKLCDKPYEIGCTEALFTSLRKSIAVIVGVAIAVAFLELLAVIMSCSLASSLRKQYEFV